MAITTIAPSNWGGANFALYSINSNFKFLFDVTGTLLPDSFLVEFWEVGGSVALETYEAFKFEPTRYFLDCNSFLRSLITVPNLNIPISTAGSYETFSKKLELKLDTRVGGLNQTHSFNYGILSKQYDDIKQYLDDDTSRLFNTVAFVDVPVYLAHLGVSNFWGRTLHNGYDVECSQSTPVISESISHPYEFCYIAGFGVTFGSVGKKTYEITYSGPTPVDVDVLPLPCEAKILNFVNRMGIPMNWAFDGATQNTDTMGTPIFVDNFINDLYNSNFKQLGVVNSTKTVKLVCNNLNEKYWHIMVDIINSPILRLHNGGAYDNNLNYVSVKMKTKSVKSSDWRRGYQDFEFEVELPIQYTPSYV